MSNTLRRTLQRTLNRHTSSDTLNRPASTDLAEWSFQVYARVQIYPDSAEDPDMKRARTLNLEPLNPFSGAG